MGRTETYGNPQYEAMEIGLRERDRIIGELRARVAEREAALEEMVAAIPKGYSKHARAKRAVERALDLLDREASR